MPYLQFDLPGFYSAAVKRDFAARISRIYAETMQTSPEMVNVGFRELGGDNLWRCFDGEPRPVAVVQCDVRRGRTAAQRLALAQALTTAAAVAFDLPPSHIVVEFSQHAADEMYRDGSWGREWTPGEVMDSP